MGGAGGHLQHRQQPLRLSFDEQVLPTFTQYVLKQPDSRLKWGAGRIVHHENLYSLVRRLKGKLEVAEVERRKAERAAAEDGWEADAAGENAAAEAEGAAGRMLRRRRAPKGTRLQRRRAPPEGMQSWTWGQSTRS